MSRTKERIAPQIIDAASEWFVALREPDLCADEREKFAKWLRASPLHVRAYLEIARLWGDAAQIGEDVDVDLAEGAATVVLLREGPAPVIAARSSSEERSRRRPLLLAASVLMACMVGGVAAWWQYRVPTYVAGIGEQRVITLEDGSMVRLNSRSTIKVRMSAGLRQIELSEGQAMFEVAKDPTRPFVVRGGDISVRAVGTQFDVYRKSSATVVTVVEGHVEVTRNEDRRLWPGSKPDVPVAIADRSENRAGGVSGASPEPIALRAGGQVIVAQSGQITQNENANVVAATSWLQHELIFSGEPLGYVVEEFNRYHKTPIVILDPELAQKRINAVFHTTSPDALLRFVARFDGVRIEKAEQEIRISR